MKAKARIKNQLDLLLIDFPEIKLTNLLCNNCRQKSIAELIYKNLFTKFCINSNCRFSNTNIHDLNELKNKMIRRSDL